MGKPNKPYPKPPIGLLPQYLWKEQRMNEIKEAVARYMEVGARVSASWLEEYNELVNNPFDYS